jgi:hypothetical protein
VRADAAAIGGKAHHQVVQARVGDEAELAQQGVGAGVEQVYALHQHGPFLLVARGQRCQRAMLHVPVAVHLGDQAGLDVILGGQVGQCVHRQQRLEAGDGLTDQ